MATQSTCLRTLIVSVAATALLWLAPVTNGQDRNAQSPQRLREPVFRVAKTPAPTAGKTAKEHPLDPAIKVARECLVNIQSNVKDYTCTLVKRERINGTLGDYEYMYTKIRNQRVANGKIVSPLSAYMYFVKPAAVKGREVLYVAGQNNGKMCAHEGGTKGRLIPSVWLAPNGVIAMKGQRYPLSEIGIENLVVKLIERGLRDRTRDECEVEFRRGAKINGRECTIIQVTHPRRRPYFDFHIARIFIDNQYNVPIRYAAYDWPKAANAKPEVVEEYTYLNLKINVGLTEEDFDTKNPKYNF
ncbi:MAG: DUF1571 domain-containing protein [Planctomycetota bacterium]|nr:DUF1571 domain-containing protein [Planctomycetota bacterium]